MRLEPLEDALLQQNGSVEPAPEDAWLNDQGPPSRLTPQMKNKVEESSTQEPSSSQLETYTLVDYAELLSEQNVPAIPVDQTSPPIQPDMHVESGRRLWPMMLRLSERIWQELYQKSDATPSREPAMIELVRKRCLDLLRANHALASQVRDLAEAEQLLQNVVSEVLGYGPLEALLKSEDISEITVAGPRLTYVVCDGELQELPDLFEDDRHILRIIENMLRRAGRHVEPHWPLADVRLPDGAYASIIMPPHAVNGPTIAIRKYPKLPLRIDDLVQLGSMTQEIADFLSACVQGRLNIIVCGSNGSGRTTLLNALSSCIPASERIVTIEDMVELKLEQRYVVALESRQAGTDSAGQVTARDLVAHALRMGAERIIVGECRGSEIVKLLQAMYTGYSGVLMTMYADNLRDCLTRLEVICQAGRMNLPLAAIQAQIVGAVNVIVYVSLLRDGSRKIMNVAEVRGVEDSTIRLQSIFYYQDTGVDAKTGNVKGIFRPGGFRPLFMPKLEAANIRLPREMFVPFHIASSSRKQ